ncbi:MAG: hypothetical protein RLY61_259 [Candidatus Parcubacteria bacterium]|jgi:hypothetical protein
MKLGTLPVKELPPAKPLLKLLGPSFIILGLGLGSGELILWPYLTSLYGLGIIWGAIVGITFQFFMNMEIERYALAKGESIFVGFARKLAFLPIWFVLSTFIPWIWPGIAASSAKILGSLFGITQTHYLAIVLLLLAGFILTIGPVLYKTVENLQKFLILLGVPIIFSITVYIVFVLNPDAVGALTKGMVGIGENYLFLPVGIPIATFLAALAYAGAGGNLNLAQSNYIKEKGYGMGEHAGRITSMLTGKAENISLEGADFEMNEKNLSTFNKWWKNINIEHFGIFWVTGVVTILMFALLAYVTLLHQGGTKSDISFIISEAHVISSIVSPFLGTFFLIIAGVMLFATQLTVLDATSRILSENIVLALKDSEGRSISKIYYTVLWIQIVTGIAILSIGFAEPLQLVIIAAVLNAFAMFVHSGLTLWLNKTALHKNIQPNMLRAGVMLLAFLFYGGFSIYTIITRLFY